MKRLDHEPLWSSEHGHRVDINAIHPSDYIVVFQRLSEGTGALQYKWKFDELGNTTESADYFIPQKETALQKTEAARMSYLREELAALEGRQS